MSPDIINALRMLVIQGITASYLNSLIIFRHPERKWRTRWIISVAGILIFNALLIVLFGAAIYDRGGVLTLMLPYNLVSLWCSKYRDARTLFAVANGTYITSIAIVVLCLTNYLLPEYPFIPIIAQLCTLILMCFVLRRFAKIARKMMEQLDKGWIFLWLLPLGSGLISMYIYNTFISVNPIATFIAQFAVLALCGGAYYTMYIFFERVQSETETKNNQRLLSVQVSGLQSRMEALSSAEEKIRIARHDMRHHLQTVRELVLEGKSEDAVSFLNNTEKNLESARTARWCKPTILNAVFTSYFEQAENNGISIEARLAFPNSIPVSEGELAIVFANALENAIHACQDTEEDKKFIKVTVINSPSMMVEISNPCKAKVKFDQDGVPYSAKEGHGIGVQSIISFCKKHNAAYQFEQKDDRFILRVIF